MTKLLFNMMIVLLVVFVLMVLSQLTPAKSSHRSTPLSQTTRIDSAETK